VKELGRLAFEGVADELENPSDHKKHGRIEPQVMEEEAGDKDRDGYENGGNAECMAGPVDWVLMAARVLRDPLLAGAVA